VPAEIIFMKVSFLVRFDGYARAARGAEQQ